MQATDATGIYEFLNDGVILDQNGFTDSLALWQGFSAGIDPTLCTLTKEGFEEPTGDPSHSLILSVNIAPPQPIIPSVGQILLLFPRAIDRRFILEMNQDGVPNEDLPSGIFVTPAIWNLETV